MQHSLTYPPHPSPKQEIIIITKNNNHNSPYSMFHSFHGLINSINWPASSIWVFIAQLGEDCSANAEATGSSPVEVPKCFFFPGYMYFRNCLNCDTTAMITSSFHLYFRSSQFTLFYVSFLSQVDELRKLACLPLYGSSQLRW